MQSKNPAHPVRGVYQKELKRGKSLRADKTTTQPERVIVKVAKAERICRMLIQASKQLTMPKLCKGEIQLLSG